MKRKLILVIAVLFLSAALSLLKASHSDAYLMKANAEALADPVSNPRNSIKCFHTVEGISMFDPFWIDVYKCDPCVIVSVTSCSNRGTCVI